MLPGMALDIQVLQGLLVAVGAGLLVGVERERHRTGSVPATAGVRTFALIGLSGALAERVGGVGIAVGGAFVVLAALAAYRASRARDPGLTTETAMLVVAWSNGGHAYALRLLPGVLALLLAFALGCGCPDLDTGFALLSG
jgi:hypothetical protein